MKNPDPEPEGRRRRGVGERSCGASSGKRSSKRSPHGWKVCRSPSERDPRVLIATTPGTTLSATPTNGLCRSVGTTAVRVSAETSFSVAMAPPKSSCTERTRPASSPRPTRKPPVATRVTGLFMVDSSEMGPARRPLLPNTPRSLESCGSGGCWLVSADVCRLVHLRRSPRILREPEGRPTAPGPPDAVPAARGRAGRGAPRRGVGRDHPSADAPLDRGRSIEAARSRLTTTGSPSPCWGGTTTGGAVRSSPKSPE